jgi:3-oxoacyl-[acyl-carrier protein] reductase|tara:strand:+ start:384 stop:1049 length:666 start_codon:yes stop_codon:yes gene_type:complete
MRNILLVGASSQVAIDLIEKYRADYNFISLSRNPIFSDFKDFDSLDTITFPKIESLDGIVYFPGNINLKPFKRIKIEEFQNDYNINVVGLLNILKFYERSLNNNSSIVMFSSVAAKVGMPFHASIAMYKSAITSLSRTLAAEWSPKIRLNTISPSLFNSTMSQKFLKDESMIERMSDKHPLNRVGSVSDISSMINFLISEKSSWITGQDFSVDGGMSTLVK